MARIVNDWIDGTDWHPRTAAPAGIETMIREALDMREIWVIGDPPEGYLSFDPETDRIGGFYCARTGAGLGKALLDAVKDGRDAMWLHTHVPNTRAQSFYRREGFKAVGVVPPEPPETVPELRMEWQR